MGPLGYVKHPDIKNKLMVDEETAWIVRKIFDLSFHGMGVNRISKLLMDAVEKFCPKRALNLAAGIFCHELIYEIFERNKV